MKKCKICNDKTDVCFNIRFVKTPICENCASAIFMQQAKWYVEYNSLSLMNMSDKCVYEQDNTTSMNCKHCGQSKWTHGANTLL